MILTNSGPSGTTTHFIIDIVKMFDNPEMDKCPNYLKKMGIINPGPLNLCLLRK
jgi:hypothetical protein